jgi:hypothetical protein
MGYGQFSTLFARNKKQERRKEAKNSKIYRPTYDILHRY